MSRCVLVYIKSFSMFPLTTKDIITLIFTAVLFTLTACISPMKGKVLPERNYPAFTNATSGYHYVPFERGMAELEYAWNINHEDNTITLNGSYEILTERWEIIKKSPLKNIKLTIEAYLLNENYEVLEVEYIYLILDKDKDFEKEKKIEKTFPFRQEYKYITYRLSYEGYY